MYQRKAKLFRALCLSILNKYTLFTLQHPISSGCETLILTQINALAVISHRKQHPSPKSPVFTAGNTPRVFCPYNHLWIEVYLFILKFTDTSYRIQLIFVEWITHFRTRKKYRVVDGGGVCLRTRSLSLFNSPTLARQYLGTHLEPLPLEHVRTTSISDSDRCMPPPPRTT